MDSEITDTREMNAPKSDQLNADDLIGGKAIFTFARITRGKVQKKGEQPMNVHLAEFPRGPWKPCKVMRRLMDEQWGINPAEWPTGLRVELYREPAVLWAGEPTGGIRICGMSHIRADFVAIVTETRGLRVRYPIRRLPDAPRQQSQAMPDLVTALAAAALTVDDLDAYLASTGKPSATTATPEQRAAMAVWLGNPQNAAKVRPASSTPETP